MGGGAPTDETDGGRGPESDSRERLIAAARELALEHFESASGLRDAFSYLTPGSVAKRARLSRGLIYHYWGDADADGSQAFDRFLEDVADRLWLESAVPDELSDLADLLPDELDDVVLALTAAELDRYTGAGRAVLRASQALTLHGASPEGAPQRLLRQIAELYRVLGDKVGLEPIPPLTYEDVAFVVLSMFEGYGLFQNVLLDHALRTVPWDPAAARTPDGAPAEGDGEWPVLAIAVRGVVRSMTRSTRPDATR